MKKRVMGKKLSRGSGARRALFKSLIRALIISGKIETTEAKAKLIQVKLDKLVTLARKNTDQSNRRVIAILGNDRKIAKELMQLVLPSLVKRNSGFTRIIPLPRRRGDFAKVARIEWADEKLTPKADKVSKKIKSLDSKKKTGSKSKDKKRGRVAKK